MAASKQKLKVGRKALFISGMHRSGMSAVERAQSRKRFEQELDTLTAKLDEARRQLDELERKLLFRDRSLADQQSKMEALVGDVNAVELELSQAVVAHQQEREELRRALVAAEAASVDRFRETARLTEMVFSLEQSIQQHEIALVVQKQQAADESAARVQNLLRERDQGLVIQAAEHEQMLSKRSGEYEQKLAKQTAEHDQKLARQAGEHDQKLAKQAGEHEQQLAKQAEEYEQKLAKQALDYGQMIARQADGYEHKLAYQALELEQLNQHHQKSIDESARALALTEYERGVVQAANLALGREAEYWRLSAEGFQETFERIRASRAWRLTARMQPKLPISEPADPALDRDAEFRSYVELLHASELFDTQWYQSRYPDVDGSGLEPIHHYLLLGALEGRNPGPHFDSVEYMVRYPDVRQAGINPLVHYIAHGRAESRDATPVAVQA